MKIFIDHNIPKNIQNKLAVMYNGCFVKNKEKADIIINYAHDRNLLLTPLEEYNLNHEKKNKTVFLCWYDWYNPTHRLFFSNYYNTNSSILWDLTTCRFVQIPCSIDTLKQIIKDLHNVE